MDSLPVEPRPEPARTGVWIAIATVSMSFAAYTSALIVRQDANPDWVHFKLPPILFFNTFVVLASSVTLYLAPLKRRRRDSQLAELPAVSARREVRWLYITLSLGLVFLVGQVIAWLNVAAQGFTLASSPSSSFFYLLTAVHGVHLLGGLGGLLYVVYRVTRSSEPQAMRAYRAASVYWHFMAALWVYVFILLAAQI
jgi:cytochrome c oxidase subunit 3